MELITIVIVTFNEEKNISECIKSCISVADRIIVLDNYSTDNTVDIAKSLGAEVYQCHLSVRKRIEWVLEGNILQSRWVLFLDADERMTPESSKEFKDLCMHYADVEGVNGIVVRYRLNFLGKDLKHGGFSPLKKLRAFRPGTAYYEVADVDEHYILKSGSMVYMKNDFLHKDFKGLKLWVDKHTIYAQRAAVDYYKKMQNSDQINYQGLEKGARIKRFLKYNIYYKMPIGLRAWFFYLYCYYFRLGFLDGKEGQIYAFLHSYWYRFMIDAFIYSNELIDQDGKEYLITKNTKDSEGV